VSATGRIVLGVLGGALVLVVSMRWFLGALGAISLAGFAVALVIGRWDIAPRLGILGAALLIVPALLQVLAGRILLRLVKTPP
jgi:hypothetical protein